MITLDNVSKWYGAHQVLKACTTETERGEVVVVSGPSGSGKSTLIKCINGLEPFQQGVVTVDGVSVGARGTDLPRLRSRIGKKFRLLSSMRASRRVRKDVSGPSICSLGHISKSSI